MNYRPLGFLLAAAVSVCLLAIPAGAASGKAAVMATIDQFVNGFNAGNVAMETATCDRSASIIDDFPPHVWHGATACADWAAAYASFAKKNGMTDGKVVLGTPSHVDITNDRAYVVVPATFAFKMHGKPVTQADCIFTLALRSVAGTWRITGWAWADH